jgi:hypothetical protein
LCKPWEHSLSRRQWLGGVGAAALGVGPFARPAVAAALTKKRRQVLFVWLDGGISQLESWDPKPDTQFGGPFRAIQTSVPGLQICELLPRCAKLMHKMAVVRSLRTPDENHSSGVAKILRGDPKNRGVQYPHFGSAIAKLIGPGESGLPPYITIKPGSSAFLPDDAGFLGPEYGALAFGDGKPPENLLRNKTVTAQDDDERKALRDRLDRRYLQRHRKQATQANSYVYNMATQLQKRQELFDASTFSPKDVERYGTHEFGRHMLLARRMLEAGVTFVKVISYGWDTHGDNFNGHQSLVPKVDGAFAAMIEDLSDRGMLDNVLVVMISEFGRTPRINGHVGRDHWPEAWSAVMAGCGIQRGAVVGKTNDRGTFITTEEYDIGSMFHTWFRALGINSDETEYDNAGQPLPIARDDMYAIKELLA